jgi:hypothetical protein
VGVRHQPYIIRTSHYTFTTFAQSSFSPLASRVLRSIRLRQPAFIICNIIAIVVIRKTLGSPNYRAFATFTAHRRLAVPRKLSLVGRAKPSTRDSSAGTGTLAHDIAQTQDYDSLLQTAPCSDADLDLEDKENTPPPVSPLLYRLLHTPLLTTFNQLTTSTVANHSLRTITTPPL